MASALGQIRMIDNDGSSVHSFFEPRNSASLTSNGTHGFETRRKRQRLASPDSEPFSAQDGVARTITSIDHADGWKGQLLAASSRKESLATDALAYLSDSTIRSKRQNTLKVEISTVAQAHVGIDGNSATISQDSNSSTRETELMIETSSNNRREATPPKKMLSIRADGKLTSPLNRGVSINSNLRTSKRDSRPSKISKTKVLIIKYGATEERRISIARKIQAVLSRDLHTADPESKISKALKMIEPAKPTHPFFLGVSARVLGQETVDNHMADENSIVDSNDNQVDTITSPMKPRSPRRSPKIVKTWTTIPGLEGKHKPVNSTTISRSTGAMDPIWPPRSMIHVRPPVVTAANHSLVRKDTQLSTGHCKMKYATIQIVEAEEIMQPYIKLVHAEGNSGTVTRLQSIDSLRHPHRRVTTGHALQNAIRKVVASRPPDPKISSKPVDQEDELSGPQNLPISAHVASTRVFKDISTSLTAFDKFECATQIWTHKYSPKRAEEVFQTGREAMVLRDWLKSLVVTSVEDARNQAMEIRNDSTVLKRPDGGLKRKKRRREEDLDGFVVSSDEEAEKPDELANSEIYETAIQHSDPLKQSVIHTGIFADYLTGGQRAANAVVISGPHGCGKTAAVYAVAQELDFEVFEINAGSRRSGKDVLEKVGDMTRNHLVNQARTSEENKKVGNSVEISGSVRPDLKPGPNGTLIASFKSKHKITKNPKGRLKRRKSCQDDEDEGREQPSQKQSVILLEEVDVLFEEDKQFWAAAMDLLTHSKRPIIMTCTDENMLPLNDMLLFAILRFTPPPKLLAIDYLLLIACNEGHLLSREAVTLLLKSKNYDLRASIMQLNFFCQMAVGDTKGGLEWMLIRPSTDRPHSEERKPLRVVSEGTYWDGVGCIGCEQPPFEWQISSGAAEYSLRNGSGSDVDAEMSFGCHSTTFSDETCREPKESSLRRLADLEQALDAVSAADIHPFSAFRHDNLTPLDATFPVISERHKSNFVEGSTLIAGEPITDHAGFSTSLGIALRYYAQKVCSATIVTSHEAAYQGATAQQGYDRTRGAQGPQRMTRASLLMAVEPIRKPPKTPFTGQKGSYSLSFDRPTSIIVEDLAPYLRSIVFYDLKLEAQRQQLNSMFSQGGRNGKKMRTTRASHAALEGGNKANTRRERWFPAKTNFALILQTGGEGWQELSWQRALEQLGASSDQNFSRRSSTASVVSSSCE